MQMRNGSYSGNDWSWAVMGSRHSTRLLSYLLFTFLVFGFVLYVHVPQRSAWHLPSQPYLYDYTEQEPLDDHQLCQFPVLNPYDESLLPFVSDPVHIRCKSRGEPLTFVDEDGKLCFNETAFQLMSYELNSLSCFYQEIIRPDGDDDHVAYGPTIPIENGTKLSFEYVAVSCSNFAGITVYNNLHAHIVKKKGLKETDRQQIRSLYSVMFFVIDSVSRLNFIRQLPKTYFFLTRNMNAIVLRGMTKVGDNTHPNIVPILTGRTDRMFEELVSSSDYDTHFLAEPGLLNSFDDWPLIWKNVSQLGYVTLLAEDQPRFAVFNYLTAGFRKPPTDHYMRPFWLALESSITHRLSSNLCFASTPKHLIQMNYVEDFMRKYKQVPYFGLSILTEISHDFVNQVGSIDDDLVDFLGRLERDDLLENTLLVVMADHGPRFDPIVQTPIGSIESRMPFNALIVPRRLRQHFPHAMANLKTNAKRLTTVFDLHATVLDLLNYGTGRNEDLGQRNVHLEDSAWGQSLFTPISLQRTCLNAGVPHQFCACETERPVSIEEPHVKAAAHGILMTLNEFTQRFRTFCGMLSLKSVQSAIALLSHSTRLKGTVKLRVTVLVSPSDALFEGLVFADVNGSVTVIEDINRINRYDRQANCLPPDVLSQNPRLNFYCYCHV